MTPWVMLAPIAVLLCVAIPELRRPTPRGGIDGLRVTAVIYCLAFVVAPLQVAGTDLRWVRASSWVWVLNHLPTTESFLGAELLAVLGWICILIGYFVVQRARARTGDLDSLVGDERSVARVMVALLALGTFALVVYTISIGGWRVLIFNALAFRSSAPPVVTRWAFLKSVAPLSLGAAFLAFGLRRDAQQPGVRRLATWVFPLAVAVSMIVLFHQAGRLSMLAFLITFPLAIAAAHGRLRLRVVMTIGVLFALLVLFGKQLFNPEGASTVFETQWQALRDEGSNAVQMIGIEFSFPFLNLAHFVQTVPSSQPFRWFVDVPLGFLYLVPQRLLGVVHPPTITALNSDALGSDGAIPVDLVSFGYVSAWLPGMLLVTGLFGVALGWLDRQARSRRFTATVLRVALMLFLAFRIMYADPTLVLQAGFYLIVLLGALWLVRRRALPLAGGGS